MKRRAMEIVAKMRQMGLKPDNAKNFIKSMSIPISKDAENRLIEMVRKELSKI